jgi:hypothetical protein
MAAASSSHTVSPVKVFVSPVPVELSATKLHELIQDAIAEATDGSRPCSCEIKQVLKRQRAVVVQFPDMITAEFAIRVLDGTDLGQGPLRPILAFRQSYVFSSTAELAAAERSAFMAGGVMPWRVMDDRVELLLSVETRGLQKWESALKLNKTVLWLLGGRRDRGEEAEACAGREFGEECGGVFGASHGELSDCLTRSMNDGAGFGLWMSFSKFLLYIVPMTDLPKPSRFGPNRLLATEPSRLAEAAEADDAGAVSSGAGGDSDEDIVEAHAGADRSVMRKLGRCFVETSMIRWVDAAALLESIPASDGRITQLAPSCLGCVELATSSGGKALRVGHFVIMMLMDKHVRKALVSAVASTCSISEGSLKDLERAAATHQRYIPDPSAKPGRARRDRRGKPD